MESRSQDLTTPYTLRCFYRIFTTASRNNVRWVDLCVLFSAVNQSQSTSLLYCRCLTNQNIQNTNLLEHKVFKSTSLSLHPYSTDDTCSKSKLHSFHSLGNFSNCYCFVAFPHFPHASQVPSDPVLSQHYTLQVRRAPGTTAGSIQFTAADELSESIFHLHTLTLSIPSSTGAHWEVSHRSPFRRKLLLTNQFTHLAL